MCENNTIMQLSYLHLKRSKHENNYASKTNQPSRQLRNCVGCEKAIFGPVIV